MKPAVEMKCADCKAEIGVGNLTKRKPRKVLCAKCFRRYKNGIKEGN